MECTNEEPDEGTEECLSTVVNTAESTCTVEELMNILTHDTGGRMLRPKEDLNLVYDGIYVGGM